MCILTEGLVFGDSITIVISVKSSELNNSSIPYVSEAINSPRALLNGL